MSFPKNPRVGMDTEGDMSGGAWNADATEKIEWAQLINDVMTTDEEDNPALNTKVAGGSLQVAIGEVALGAADPGLVALATALAGVSTPKTLLSLYNLLAAAGTESGITVKTLPAITGTVGVTNLDTSINTLFTTTGIKIASWPASVGVTNTSLSNIDTSLNTLFTTTGIKIATLPAISDAVLTAVEDTSAHYLGVKEAPSGTIVSGTNASMPANGASAGVALTSSQACSEVTIQAPATNTVDVLFGSSASTCVMHLSPGRDFTTKISNVNKIFVMSQTSDTTPTVSWISRA